MAEEWASKDALFKSRVPCEKHLIPGVGNVVVYGLTGGQKDDYENQVIQVTAGSRKIAMANARALLLILTVHDQHGNRFFADKDMGRVSNLPATIVDPLYDKARRLSAMGITDIEELVKNSEVIRSDGSATGSPQSSDGP